ncbi:MAG: polyphosphate polymerase domain-containing protein, partial [Bacteroidota bacterium]
MKYVLPTEEIIPFLNVLPPDWQILKINTQVLHTYENLYFDTDNFQCYLDHHNEKKSRYKFRIRTYQQTGASFLEVKEKTNKEKTLKTRLHRSTANPHLTEVEKAWLRQLQSRINPAFLQPQLQTRYRRISLIHPDGNRLTIDQGLVFKTADRTLAFPLPRLAVVELKKCHQIGLNHLSPPFRQMGMASIPLSKYCLGILL